MNEEIDTNCTYSVKSYLTFNDFVLIMYSLISLNSFVSNQTTFFVCVKMILSILLHLIRFVQMLQVRKYNVIVDT